MSDRSPDGGDVLPFERPVRRAPPPSQPGPPPSPPPQQMSPEFAALMHRPVKAMYVVLGIIGVMAVAQLALGGFDVRPSATRLGALSPVLVREGEWWRLVTVAFLHGGLMHLGFNLYVLYQLGGFAERLLGPVRLVVVFCAAVLGGSIASTLFLDPSHYSVGASGGLWGLLGAHAVLAFRPGALPEGLVPGARRAAIINLLLNVAVSAMPNVDVYGHLGGGLTGAALMLLPGMNPAHGTGEVSAPPAWVKGLAGTLALIFAAALGTGLAMGRPWELRMEPTRAEVELGGLRFTAPDLERKSRSDGATEQAWSTGDPTRDALAVDVGVMLLHADDQERPLEWYAAARLLPDVGGFERDGELRIDESGPRRVAVQNYRLGGDADGRVGLQMAWTVAEGRLVVATEAHWTALRPGGEALRIVQSVASVE